MNAALVVWIEGATVGDLRTQRGGWWFKYRRAWLDSEGKFALSPHLPLRPEPFVDDADDRRVLWFFDNLLPEGGVREALARWAGMDERDVFGLLARFGEESAGALTLLPEGAEWHGGGGYERLSTGSLRELLGQLPEMPLIVAGGKAKMSLAGAQHKLGLHRTGDEFLLPRQAPSSLILKPGTDRFPHVPANEHFCMALARRIGLKAPHSELQHLPEPVFLVRRFDRRIEGGRVGRLHQLDLCQMLNRWPGYKYEADGGASFGDVFQALERTRQPAVARLETLRWVVFNYLVGNSDAHAKNLSFLVGPDGLTLAPAYDLLCTRIYGDPDMAMSIGDQIRYGWVESADWDALARTAGVKASLLRRIRADLSARLPWEARQVLQDEAFHAEERSFLGQLVDVVDEHSARLQRSA